MASRLSEDHLRGVYDTGHQALPIRAVTPQIALPTVDLDGLLNASDQRGFKTVTTSSRRTLVLNATYEPLGVVSDRRALILVLNNRASVIEESGITLHYSSGSLELPAVIRLHKFVKIPYRHTVPLSRRAIFARDGGRCVYCSATATSIDHVVPRSRR